MEFNQTNNNAGDVVNVRMAKWDCDMTQGHTQCCAMYKRGADSGSLNCGLRRGHEGSHLTYNGCGGKDEDQRRWRMPSLPQQLLSLNLGPLPEIEPDSEFVILRRYLKKILSLTWENGEWCDKGSWQFVVYAAMIRGNFIEGELDSHGYVNGIDIEKADQLILAAIKEL